MLRDLFFVHGRRDKVLDPRSRSGFEDRPLVVQSDDQRHRVGRGSTHNLSERGRASGGLEGRQENLETRSELLPSL